TTWRWKVSGGDRVDDTGKSGLRSAVGATRCRGAGDRNKSATHAPTLPYAGGAIRNPATNPPTGEKRNETPAISRRTSTTTTLIDQPLLEVHPQASFDGKPKQATHSIAFANPVRSTRRPIAIARPTRKPKRMRNAATKTHPRLNTVDKREKRIPWTYSLRNVRASVRSTSPLYISPPAD